MGNSVWGPTLQAQQNAIGILMQKRALDEDRRQFEIKVAEAKAERDQKDQQELMKIVQEAQKAKVDYAKDMMKTAYEKGDTQGLKKFGAPLQEQGFPVPGQALPQKQGMTEAELTQRAIGGDKLAQSILDRMARRKIETSRAGAPNITIQNNESIANLGSKTATKKYAEKVGDRVDQRFGQAEEANRQNAQLDQVTLALSQGARTGAGEELLLNLRSLGQTMGVDVGDLSDQELIRKISNEMALRLRNPESGLGLTGNTSNRDLQFLKDSVIGLSRTEQGNKAIINAMRKFNTMRVDVAKKQSEIISSNGGVVPIDLDRKIMEYANKYELFSTKERQKIESYLEGKSKSRFRIIKVE